ncbi:MAG: methyltransferase domain-containing protein [Proteobacteria bacterium]|nr:methyltransferase domain-containing protein [Pseudomonadota bacterium]
MPRYKNPDKMPDMPFCRADLAHEDFQYLEDLSTAYWYSEVLFAAIKLGLFVFLEKGISSVDKLAIAASCSKEELHRLLKAMEKLTLVCHDNGLWFNSQVTRMFLVPGQPSYMGEFFLYRKYMQPQWQSIANKVSINNEDETTRVDNNIISEEDEYALRNFNYVMTADVLIQQKNKEIVSLLKPFSWQLPLLDIGGGAGSLGRSLIKSKINDTKNQSNEIPVSILFELPEVINAAHKLYSDRDDWQYFESMEGDFILHKFDEDKKYGLIIMSNFLHAYGNKEAHELFLKAASLLKKEGMILIHDYFPDRFGRNPQKGALYDLNMMLNTYNGTCHESSTIKGWLEEAGFNKVKVIDLGTDTSIILAAQDQFHYNLPIDIHEKTNLDKWVYAAVDEGFKKAVILPVAKIATGSWVRQKCRFGCSEFGKKLQCPPYSIDNRETEEMLKSYSWCMLVEDMPPGRKFHKKLLNLEKRLFLAGFHKAFSFGAGPCPVCKKCPDNNICLHPDLARPSMEASGIDVYETAKAAGITLKPVSEKDRYVKYIGLLLLE